ncbi:33407_t:CDS:2, partial [Racocetra persica]
ITCDGNAEQIIQAVITTGSNIIQTFMTYIPTQQFYSDENMKNFITLKEGKPNLTNDYKLIKLLERYENDIPELKIVIYASMELSINDKLQYNGVSNTDKDAREKIQIKLNLKEILRKTQKTKVIILLENSASNKCYGANIEELILIKKSIKKELQYFEDDKAQWYPRIKLCFDTQHYFAARAGRFIEDCKEVLDKNGKEIHLIYINNVMKERKFQQQSGT